MITGTLGGIHLDQVLVAAELRRMCHEAVKFGVSSVPSVEELESRIRPNPERPRGVSTCELCSDATLNRLLESSSLRHDTGSTCSASTMSVLSTDSGRECPVGAATLATNLGWTCRLCT